MLSSSFCKVRIKHAKSYARKICTAQNPEDESNQATCFDILFDAQLVFKIIRLDEDGSLVHTRRIKADTIHGVPDSGAKYFFYLWYLIYILMWAT